MTSITCKNFLNAIDEDRLVVKLFKYRFFLTNNKEQAIALLNEMLDLALS